MKKIPKSHFGNQGKGRKWFVVRQGFDLHDFSMPIQIHHFTSPFVSFSICVHPCRLWNVKPPPFLRKGSLLDRRRKKQLRKCCSASSEDDQRLLKPFQKHSERNIISEESPEWIEDAEASFEEFPRGIRSLESATTETTDLLRMETGEGVASSVALSSQTDLSKMSSFGDKAYHTLSTKNPKQRKQLNENPPSIKTKTENEAPEKLQLVFVSAEVAPFSKTGGLGDVIGSLPFVLAQRGHRVMVISPRFYFLLTITLYEALDT